MGILDRFKIKKDNISPVSEINNLPSPLISDIMLKAFSLPLPSQVSEQYMPNPKYLQHWDENQEFRRAIASVSNYYNTLGIFRSGFDKNLNDRLADNIYFGLVEKAIQDYLASLDFKVTDKRGEHVDSAEYFLHHPNPQDTWDDLLKAMIPDLLRYDAGVWVKTFDASDYLVELKAFLGTEFWPEIDRDIMHIGYPSHILIPKQIGYLSRGYVQRWWQRSRTGLYISFLPEEIVYFSLYPKSDDVYGTDYISLLRYQIQYLIDSTRAAGMTFANGVVPSIIWNHPQAFTPEQLAVRINEVKTANKGAQNFGAILHTVKDEKIDTLAHTLHDMEWLEGQRFMGQLVWAMWGFQPSEFVGSSVNRATAYVGRNITKSKVIYPLLKFIEAKINSDVLPYLKGYHKSWHFSFIRDIDLDDEIKMAEITATKANTASIFVGMGIAVPAAMKLAGMGDSIKTVDFEYYTLDELSRMKSVTKPQNDDHGNPKQFAQAGGMQRESAAGTEMRKLQFGDQEERNAGIQKSLKLTDNQNVEIVFIPQGPSIISNQNPDSKSIAREIRKDLQETAKNHREQMKDPDIWGPVICKYIDKYNLDVI